MSCDTSIYAVFLITIVTESAFLNMIALVTFTVTLQMSWSIRSLLSNDIKSI